MQKVNWKFMMRDQCDFDGINWEIERNIAKIKIFMQIGSGILDIKSSFNDADSPKT